MHDSRTAVKSFLGSFQLGLGGNERSIVVGSSPHARAVVAVEEERLVLLDRAAQRATELAAPHGPVGVCHALSFYVNQICEACPGL